jgi:putative SOS response-associated peptidase YedK
MCGRFVLAAPPSEVRNHFGHVEVEDFPPRYNIAPTQPIATIRLFEGARHFALVRWGLVPGWVKDPASFSLLINARSETADRKPSFRTAMRHRRCLVPATGYYEWRLGRDGRKQPYHIRPRGGGLIALAGLWEEWCDPDGGIIDTGALMTVPANDALSHIHDRMPVVIAPEHFDLWLDVKSARPQEIQALLKPAPDHLFEAFPVGRRVNGARDDDAGLLEPVELETEEPRGVPAKRRAADEGGAGGGGQLDLF